MFAWENNQVAFGINLAILIIVYAIAFLAAFKISKRRIPLIIVVICFVFASVCFVFNAYVGQIVITAILIVTMSTLLYTNIGDLRKFLAAPFKKTNVKSNAMKVTKIFDSKSLYKTVENAVLDLSKTRTGAIITFEKTTLLSDVIKNGVAVNAPVTTELLETIFYPGTRLHDGAVVVRGNEIIAASVFFTPTTKPFATKYGSRHRAALGISEISDSVTVVVSEETGRISIARNGELESVKPEDFYRMFETNMNDFEE